MVVFLTVLALTWWSFEESSILALVQRALVASMDALTFSIVDSIVKNSMVYFVEAELINKFVPDLWQLVVSTGSAGIFSDLDHILRISQHRRSIKQKEIEIRIKKTTTVSQCEHWTIFHFIILIEIIKEKIVLLHLKVNVWFPMEAFHDKQNIIHVLNYSVSGLNFTSMGIGRLFSSKSSVNFLKKSSFGLTESLA